MKKMNDKKYWLTWYVAVLAFLLAQIFFYDYITQLFQ